MKENFDGNIAFKDRVMSEAGGVFLVFASGADHDNEEEFVKGILECVGFEEPDFTVRANDGKLVPDADGMFQSQGEAHGVV